MPSNRVKRLQLTKRCNPRDPHASILEKRWIAVKAPPAARGGGEYGTLPGMHHFNAARGKRFSTAMGRGAAILHAAITIAAASAAPAVLAAGAAIAAPPEGGDTRALAAACAACHGTDGIAVGLTPMPRLAGLSRDYLLAQMRAFRDGSRPATVMQQIAKGFSDAQTARLADYFAAVR